jgi:hypothetical protein
MPGIKRMKRGFLKNKKLLKIFLAAITGITISGVAGILWVMLGMYGFLAQNDRVEAEILVVEGWLPEYALEEAIKEFRSHPYKKMVTTGGPIDSTFRMHSNGTLHLRLPDSISVSSPDSRIVIEAQGTPLDRRYPHFTLWANDTICIGEASVWWNRKKYIFPLQPGIPAINSLHITYDNDAAHDMGNRDLFIRSVKVNDYKTSYLAADMVYEHYSAYTREKVAFSEKTMAETAAFYLKRMGLKDNEVIAVPSPPVRIHRTYTSAVALKEWLKKNNVHAVNILSLGTHARRSCLSYKKVLRDYEDIQIGIIALEDKKYDPDNWWRNKKSRRMIMREALKYTYIQFFFDLV